MPQLSIITIAYNNISGLKATFESVVNQSAKDYEFIIIDGGSSDGTKEFLEQNTASISYWVSEPDKGIYNAMNKGIKVAKGDYLLFLNSGDLFSDSRILELVLPQLTGEDLVYGDAYYETPERKYKYKIPRKITLGTLLKEPICHQSAFFRREFMIENGCYDESNRIASDHIFNLKVFIEGSPTQKHIPIYISVFDKTGVSCTNPNLGFDEINRFLDKTLSKELQQMALDYDEYQQFYHSLWGKYARKIKSWFYKIKYIKNNK